MKAIFWISLDVFNILAPSCFPRKKWLRTAWFLNDRRARMKQGVMEWVRFQSLTIFLNDSYPFGCNIVWRYIFLWAAGVSRRFCMVSPCRTFCVCICWRGHLRVSWPFLLVHSFDLSRCDSRTAIPMITRRETIEHCLEVYALSGHCIVTGCCLLILRGSSMASDPCTIFVCSQLLILVVVLMQIMFAFIILNIQHNKCEFIRRPSIRALLTYPSEPFWRRLLLHASFRWVLRVSRRLRWYSSRILQAILQGSSMASDPCTNFVCSQLLLLLVFQMRLVRFYIQHKKCEFIRGTSIRALLT